jgi:hypothetical protein
LQLSAGWHACCAGTTVACPRRRQGQEAGYCSSSRGSVTVLCSGGGAVCCHALQCLLQQPPLQQPAWGQRKLCAGAGQGLCVCRVPGASGWRDGGCALSRCGGGSKVRRSVLGVCHIQCCWPIQCTCLQAVLGAVALFTASLHPASCVLGSWFWPPEPNVEL